jgi:hypothetical protein
VINELINNKNRVLEQNFALKECEDGVYDIEDEDLLIEMGDLEISKYKSRLFEDGVTLVYAESPRGFAKGICENKASKLPKSFIDYQKLSSGSFNIVSNLEFFARRLLNSKEFESFKTEAYSEDCDDKYIFLSKIEPNKDEEEPPIILC